MEHRLADPARRIAGTAQLGRGKTAPARRQYDLPEIQLPNQSPEREITGMNRPARFRCELSGPDRNHRRSRLRPFENRRIGPEDSSRRKQQQKQKNPRPSRRNGGTLSTRLKTAHSPNLSPHVSGNTLLHRPPKCKLFRKKRRVREVPLLPRSRDRAILKGCGFMLTVRCGKDPARTHTESCVLFHVLLHP